MGNALTDALKFKKAIGAPTRGLYPPKTQHNSANTQEGGMGMLTFTKDKVHNLGNAKQGDKVTLTVHGVHAGPDPNGNMRMHVHDVKPDSTGMEKTQYPEQKVPVRGVESRSS